MIGPISASALAAPDGKVVFGELFTPASGWALETIDSYILSRAGCLESLTYMDYDASIKPALAESWEQVSPTEWEFQLREGVAFQDGTALTPQVVSDSLNRVLNASSPPRSFNPGVIDSVEPAGERAVRITTNEPDVFVPNRLASTETGFLAPAAFVDDRINPVGHCTGPFEIVREIPRQGLELKRNDGYWGGEVQLAEAEVRYIPDGQVRSVMVETGEIHIARQVPASALEQLERSERVEVKTIEAPRTTSLYLNNRAAPLDNMQVRQAIQSAIDLTGIAEAVYEGSVNPAVGQFSPNTPWAPENAAAMPQDLERAHQLLAESGVPASELQFELLAYVERPVLADLAAVIQFQLQQLGIRVNIRVSEYGAIEPQLLAGDFDMVLMSRGYLTDVGDPAGVLVADYSCDGGYNLAGFCDPEVDAQLERASGMVDPEERNVIYQDLAARLQEEAVNVFLIHETISEAVARNVENYQVHAYERTALHKDLKLNSQ
ncbi:ABC transporter substrate-binding protein [Halomonas sp. M5N1S17]|uniref:ABC transporter substrate-binding protein n=1 Tax=Halomonas alkalisoli TaxID=2907158 RepID=UPI001F254110|nr:ABC transporter substrate-binding protein [Halomonas alkalisoli]MCE9662581.1 ABC transporter substrate-binding protein [Halomonas alkalisoli]MCE9666015.1 ABC transporter substrate-binding protein [Halomonas alkalisoli]